MRNLRDTSDVPSSSSVRYYHSLPIRNQGVTILGPNQRAYIGSSISFIGDFNGDGYDDIVIGADGMYNQLGGAYVIFGGSDLTEIDLAHLSPNRGFHLMNIVPQHDETKKYDDDDRLAGSVVIGLGDINGDGLKDFAIASTNCIFVIYGNKQSSSSLKAIDLSQLHSDSYRDIGFVIRSPGANVGHVGDVNGDGYDDIFVASANTDYVAAIIYGCADKIHEDIALDGPSEENDGSGSNSNRNGRRDPSGSNKLLYTVITKPHSSSFLHQIAGVGDVNGDGLQDFAVVSYDLSCAFVLYGDRDMSKVINLNFVQISRGIQGEFKAGIEHSHGFAVYGGLGTAPNFGSFLSGGGDINGDGISDIVVGCSNCQYHEDQTQGLAIVIYGSTSGNEERDKLFFDLRDGEDIPLSYRIFHTPHIKDIAFVGDINHDGLDDLAIVGTGNTKTNSTKGGTLSNSHHDGEPIILFGQKEFPFFLNTDGVIHGKIPGIVTAGDRHHDYTGSTIDRYGSGGDFNGDGFDDLVVGQRIFTPYDNIQRSDAGVVQIVYGYESNAVGSKHAPTSTARSLVMMSPLFVMLLYVIVMACRHFSVKEFMMSHYKAAGSMRSAKYQAVATSEEEDDEGDGDEEMNDLDNTEHDDALANHSRGGVEMVSLGSPSKHSRIVDQEDD